MENVSYALKIAGATLIAVLVIALIVIVFQSLKSYQQSQEDAVTRENMSEFNTTFEVYNKSLMYGTDVLSCLNQAESNNQKYVYNVYYGEDNSNITYAQRMELMVQVNVTLKTPVQEEIKVYHRSDLTGGITQTANSESYNFKPFSNSKGFKLPQVTFYYFTGTQTSNSDVVQNVRSYNNILWDGANTLSTSQLKGGSYNTNMGADTYSLVANSTEESKETGMLIALLSTVTEVEQTIYNDSYTGTGYEGSNAWYSATWITAAYNFKTKKFKCTDISYSESGYVNSLSFEEVINDD